MKNEAEHLKYGRYEKRDQVFQLDVTPKEKEDWTKCFGRNLAKTLRRMLDELAAQQKMARVPKRPHYVQQYKTVISFKCSESELWNWKMVVPGYGKRTRLGAVCCGLLAQEYRRQKKIT